MTNVDLHYQYVCCFGCTFQVSCKAEAEQHELKHLLNVNTLVYYRFDLVPETYLAFYTRAKYLLEQRLQDLSHASEPSQLVTATPPSVLFIFTHQ